MLVMGFVAQYRQHHDLKVAQAGVGTVARETASFCLSFGSWPAQRVLVMV